MYTLTKSAMKWFAILAMLLWVGIAQAAILNDTYHSVQFKDSSVSNGGSNETNHMDVSFSGANNVSFVMQNSSSGAPVPMPTTYSLDEENTLVVGTGDNSDVGTIDTVQDIFILNNTNELSDNSLMLMLGAKKTSGMAPQALQGQYVVGQYMDENLSSSIVTKQMLFDFNNPAPGDVFYSTISSSNGTFDSGNATYFLSDDGAMTINGAGSGFLSAPNYEMFAIVDTDSTNSDINIMIAVERGQTLTNATLKGNYSFASIAHENGRTVTSRALLSFDGSTDVNGEGNAFYVNLDSSNGGGDTSGFLYKVNPDGALYIDGTLSGHVSITGKALIITETAPQNALELGVGIQRPTWQINSVTYDLISNDQNAYIDWPAAQHSAISQDGGYMLIEGQFYSVDYTDGSDSWTPTTAHKWVRLMNCDQTTGTTDGTFPNLTGKEGSEIAYFDTFPQSGDCPDPAGSVTITYASNPGNYIEWGYNKYTPAVDDYVQLDGTFYYLMDAGEYYDPAFPENSYSWAALQQVDENGTPLDEPGNPGIPLIAQLTGNETGKSADFFKSYPQCGAEPKPAPDCSDMVNSSGGATIYWSDIGNCGSRPTDSYAYFNNSYYYIDYSEHDGASNYYAYLRNCNQATGAPSEPADSPSFSGETGPVDFYNTWPVGASGCPAPDGIGNITYAMLNGDYIQWGYLEHPAAAGEYVTIENTTYYIFSAGIDDISFNYRWANLQQIDPNDGTPLESPPGTPLPAQLSGNESGQIEFFSSYPQCGSTDPVDSDNDGMSDAFETANGLNPNNSNDAADNGYCDSVTDIDCDGVSNYNEFLAGNDPQDGSDYPQYSPLSVYLTNTPPFYADGGPLNFNINGMTTGETVVLRLYYDENGDGYASFGEWPFVTAMLTDNGGTNDEDFTPDSNLADGSISTIFGSDFGFFAKGNFVVTVEDLLGNSYAESTFTIEESFGSNTLSGQVIEQNFGPAVPNALVWFATPDPNGGDDHHTVSFGFTDGNGAFELQVNDALPLSGFIGADKNNGTFLSYDGPTMQVNMSGDLTINDPIEIINVTDNTRVTGKVLDYVSMRPVANAEVSSNKNDYYASAFTQRLMPIQEDAGSYTLPLQSGPGQTWVEVDELPPGYFAAVEAASGNYYNDHMIDTPTPGSTHNVDFWAFPVTATIKVHVQTEDFIDVEGIEVAARRSDNPPVPFSQLGTAKFTDIDGQTDIGVSEGDWDIQLCTACHVPKVQGVPREVVPEGSLAVDGLNSGDVIYPPTMKVYYAEGAIEGYVFHNDGQPANDIDVVAEALSAEYSPGSYLNDVSSSARTDMNGFFRVPVLGGGGWKIRAYRDNMISDLYGDDYVSFIFPSDNNAVDPQDVYHHPSPLILIGEHCNDGIQNGDETSIDSGASCDMTPPTQHNLSINVDGPGYGNVVSTQPDSQIDTTISNNQGLYYEKSDVTLVATPDSFYSFGGWTGPGVTCGLNTTCVVTMDQAKMVTATFSDAMRNLSINVDGPGYGYVVSTQPDNQIDTSQGSHQGAYYLDTNVTLQAEPAPNSMFIGWTGTGVACGASTTCVVTVDQAKTVTATFALPANNVDLTPSLLSPQNMGQSVAFNANAAGGSGNYEYKFILKDPLGNWTDVQLYSSTNSWVWDTTGISSGTYQVVVHARNSGSSALYETFSSQTYVLNNMPVASATLSPDMASPQIIGQIVTLTASGAGGTSSYEYKFSIKDPLGNWTVPQDYSQDASFTWTTTGFSAGSYQVVVHVRNLGSLASYEAYAAQSYSLLYVPASSVTLSPDLASPQNSGQTVVFTADGSSGSGSYEYKFSLKDPLGNWTVPQDYSTSTVWNWNTTGITAGNYQVVVHVRNSGSAAAYEAYATLNYTIDTVPLSGVILSAGETTPYSIGQSVTFSATPSGGGTLEYRFYLKDPSGTWIEVQPYSASSSWPWMAGNAGTYQVVVHARNVGSLSNFEAFDYIYVTVQ